MIKTQPIKKYIAPAIVATSIAVFSPVLIDDVSAHGGPDIEETNNGAQTSNTEESTSSSSDSSETKAENGSATILSDIGTKELQKKLNDKGQDIAEDGANGPDTEKAVRAVQKDEGIQEDGIVGDDTIDVLGISLTSTGGEDGPNAPAPGGGGNDKDDAPDPDLNGSALENAEELIGTPYVFGGDDPATGLDSSGFINAAFSDKNLSRTHADMWENNGTEVSEPQKGDVVFFEGTYKGGVSHSGIYTGNGEMIHAGNEGTGVEKTSMEIGYWSDKYIGAKRF